MKLKILAIIFAIMILDSLVYVYGSKALADSFDDGYEEQRIDEDESDQDPVYDEEDPMYDVEDDYEDE